MIFADERSHLKIGLDTLGFSRCALISVRPFCLIKHLGSLELFQNVGFKINASHSRVRPLPGLNIPACPLASTAQMVLASFLVIVVTTTL